MSAVNKELGKSKQKYSPPKNSEMTKSSCVLQINSDAFDKGEGLDK